MAIPSQKIREMLSEIIRESEQSEDEDKKQCLGLNRPIIDLQLLEVFAKAKNMDEENVFMATCVFIKDNGKITILDQSLQNVARNPFKMIKDAAIPKDVKEEMREVLQADIYAMNAHPLEMAKDLVKKYAGNHEDHCDCPDLADIDPTTDAVN